MTTDHPENYGAKSWPSETQEARRAYYEKLARDIASTRLEDFKKNIYALPETKIQKDQRLSDFLLKANASRDFMKIALHKLAEKGLNVDLIPEGHFIEMKDSTVSLYSKGPQGEKVYWNGWKEISFKEEAPVEESKPAPAPAPAPTPAPEEAPKDVAQTPENIWSAIVTELESEADEHHATLTVEDLKLKDGKKILVTKEDGELLGTIFIRPYLFKKAEEIDWTSETCSITMKEEHHDEEWTGPLSPSGHEHESFTTVEEALEELFGHKHSEEKEHNH